MKGIGYPLLAILALHQVQVRAQNIFNQASRAITQEIADTKNPIVGGISYIGSSQCSNVKKLIGVDYEQVVGVKEPDLSSLTLNFICPELTVEYKLGARLLLMQKDVDPGSKMVNVRHYSFELTAQYKLGAVSRLLPVQRGVDPRSKMVIFMHGFTDNPNKTNFQNINAGFQSIGHYNILALDASPLIRWLYLHSSTYVRFIGEELGETLAAMVEHGLAPNDIHLIGHSLGAHISAFAAKRFTELTGKKVGRVTGLDPAGPCFSHVDDNLRLKATDADFVDAIHTDGGVYGITDPVAQADYYANGGSQQPNCFFESCSHSRAVELFAESIRRRDAFPALKCADYDQFKDHRCSKEISLMGLSAKPGTKGQFFLQTNQTEPYGIYMEGINYLNKDGLVKSIGTGVSNIFG